jgi:hypothetical protein
LEGLAQETLIFSAKKNEEKRISEATVCFCFPNSKLCNPKEMKIFQCFGCQVVSIG